MPHNLEIEYKNMLTKAEFDKLCQHFAITDEDFIEQTNTYFDTKDMSLKKQQAALRIRTKQSKSILTLKQKDTLGMLETHQSLDDKEVEALMTCGIYPDGDVARQLKVICKSPSPLYKLGMLKTKRHERSYENGLLVLDHSYYSETQDYEIEYEVTNPVKGLESFNDFLNMWNIPKRESKNKIARLYVTLDK